jgi:predicted transcriptional regulator
MSEKVQSVEMTADIVSAYVSNNTVASNDLPALIQHVYKALEGAANGVKTEDAAPPTPAISIKKSVTPDYLISLKDGRRYKSLKRHLSTRGMTPDDYRTKWGLPRDYPMVAANYSAQRSELAKKLGLGQGGRRPAAVEVQARPRRAREGLDRATAHPDPAGTRS